MVRESERIRLRALLLVGLACAFTVYCAQQPTADHFYATAGGKLVTIDVQGPNVTVTPVGPVEAAGCVALARSTTGVLYSVCGPGTDKPDQPQQLATLDPKTGHATMFGNAVTGLQVMGLEFAPDGTLYTVGDANSASPTFSSLYTVNIKTGEFTRIGSTGAPSFFHDFAFDAKGTLYGSAGDGLYTIDLKTGTASKVTDFIGGGGFGVMGLSYNAKQDRMYATDFRRPNSALYVVDIGKGFLTPIATVGLPFSHGLVPMTP